jgi:hypothetical protein
MHGMESDGRRRRRRSAAAAAVAAVVVVGGGGRRRAGADRRGGARTGGRVRAHACALLWPRGGMKAGFSTSFQLLSLCVRVQVRACASASVCVLNGKCTMRPPEPHMRTLQCTTGAAHCATGNAGPPEYCECIAPPRQRQSVWPGPATCTRSRRPGPASPPAGRGKGKSCWPRCASTMSGMYS